MCTIVIGWGAIAVAVLMAFSGLMALLVSVSFGEGPERDGGGAGLDFVFRHFGVLAGLQVCCAAVLAVAGRGLLLLRRWAAHVIQGAAWLVLGVMGLEAVLFVREFVGALAKAPRQPDRSFEGAMVVMTVFVLLFWATPVVLAIRSLRSARVKRILQ